MTNPVNLAKRVTRRAHGRLVTMGLLGEAFQNPVILLDLRFGRALNGMLSFSGDGPDASVVARNTERLRYTCDNAN